MNVLEAKKSMNVFTYAAANEAMFESFMSECGHERITTFFSDLSIAEYYGTKEIKDTYDRVVQEWLGDYKYFTEFVLSLNQKIWQWYKYDEETAKLYNDLWDDAQDKFYEKYENDQEAKDYYFRITD